jgi:thiosulfate reductase cytochrome b subunit
LALLVTGVEIVISHPRFYWGETGNIHTQALFQIPIPASRHSVPTGYGFVLPDQNGWSRHLHFQAAWGVVLTGLLYFLYGLTTRHFTRNLVPRGGGLGRDLVAHLRFRRPGPAEAWSYNPVQRMTYLLVIFVLFPLMIWTGLAMSPAFVSACPAAVSVFGGQQSARTIHFFLTIVLFSFLLVHVGMVWLAGFRNRMRAMVTGRAASIQEHS